MLDWAAPAAEDGFRCGFAMIGVPLEKMSLRSVHGWVYMHAVPLGGPDTGGAPPPKLVLSALFRLLPALRRRHATARSVFVDRPWNTLSNSWRSTGRAEALARHAELAAVEIEGCGNDALAAHLLAVHAAAADAYRTHFTHVAPAAAITGRFAIRTSELTGQPIDEVFEMLAGYSTATTEPFELLDRVVAALPASLDLSQEPETALSSIAALDGEAATALSSYLDRYGDTIVGGESPLDPTLRELPSVIVASLRSRQHQRRARSLDYADERATATRALVPSEHHDEWNELLEDARRVTALRDDDAGVALRLIGRSRLVLLEAGRRLHRQGIVNSPESVFDLTTTEIVDLLDGSVTTTDADERRSARLVAATQMPPAVLGPPEDPPDFSIFPRAVRIVTESVFAYIARLDAPTAGPELTGVGIGTEAVTGTARIVATVADLDRVEPGDIVVTEMTTPAYNAVIAGSAALVCDHGGSTSHAAIMAREFGIPAVIGTRTATTTLIDGETVSVDAEAGLITRA
jgi:pyruvate,water dikinase